MNQSSDDNFRVTELKKLGELRDSGILTEEEFEAEKQRLLNPDPRDSKPTELYRAGSYVRTDFSPSVPQARSRALRWFLIYLRINLVILTFGISELVLFLVRKQKRRRVGN